MRVTARYKLQMSRMEIPNALFQQPDMDISKATDKLGNFSLRAPVSVTGGVDKSTLAWIPKLNLVGAILICSDAEERVREPNWKSRTSASIFILPLSRISTLRKNIASSPRRSLAITQKVSEEHVLGQDARTTIVTPDMTLVRSDSRSPLKGNLDTTVGATTTATSNL